MSPMPLKKLKNQRVFAGFNQAGTAGISSFTRVLRRRGYQIDFYGFAPIRFGMAVDYLLELPINPFASLFWRLRYFFKILPRYDVWHFNYGQTFFFYPLNLLILKLWGKKIVCTFRGSDVRRGFDFLPPKKILNQKSQKWPEWYLKIINQPWHLKFKRFLRMTVFCVLANKIVLTGPFLASSVLKYDYIIPYARAVEKKKIAPYRNRRNLVILHVPSEPVVKGTAEIERVFKVLQKKYPQHHFKIAAKMSHQALLQEMAKADIVVEQLLMGWYSGQAVEAMMLKKPVMSFLNPSYCELVSFGREIPIVNTNFWSFKKDLEILINSSLARKTISQQCLEFAKKYHRSDKIADQYLEIYEEVSKKC